MTKEEINKICKEYGIHSCTINKDMSIDVDGDVDLSYQKFKQLPLTFNKVSGDFYCHSCQNLTSLQGAPKEVSGDFSCNNCTNLTSLHGAPKEVGGDFYCNNCPNLTSLQGGPKEVGGDFFCSSCQNLTSLDYMILKCKIEEKRYILSGTKITEKELDRYLLKRVLLGDYDCIDMMTDASKVKALKTMIDFDLL